MVLGVYSKGMDEDPRRDLRSFIANSLIWNSSFCFSSRLHLECFVVVIVSVVDVDDDDGDDDVVAALSSPPILPGFRVFTYYVSLLFFPLFFPVAFLFFVA